MAITESRPSLFTSRSGLGAPARATLGEQASINEERRFSAPLTVRRWATRAASADECPEPDYAKIFNADWRSGDASQPLYARIVDRIRALICEKVIGAGDLLPPERELASILKVSRGTVSLAYDELRRERIIAATPGRGSIVTADTYVSNDSRKERAIRVLSNAASQLEELAFSPREIESFLHLVLLARNKTEVKIRAGLTECNREVLELLGKQLGIISNIEVTDFTLESLASSVPNCDVVITTETHRELAVAEVRRQKLPVEMVISVAVAPTNDTIISIARLDRDCTPLILTESRRFNGIVADQLAASGLGNYRSACLEDGHDRIMQVMGACPLEKLCVITAPKTTSAYRKMETYLRILGERLGRDPSMVCFDYQIDRGSLMRLEEAITAKVLRKGEELSLW